ncbi:DUF6882 domain-containing protein [Methanobrevibacter sp. DSM 116169]|uniref:DUF6882 domain-containing protein n=1 Tax=Methanobrevibacter sp. DSM 116169 TaxID=3242727 RepID=UPI0038FCAF74
MKEVQTPLTIEEKDSFKTIFSKYGAYAYDKQENLANLIGDLTGSLDIDNGTLEFNDDIKFDVQILAFYSNEFNQLSWAWDNENIGFDESLVKNSLEIKKFGEKYDIAEFTTPSYKIDFDDCHIIAMIASSLLDVDAYYLASFEDLDIFVTIKSDLIKKDNSSERFRKTFNNFQKNFDVFARPAFEGYAKLKGCEFKEREEFSVAKNGEDRLIAGFSERGNLTHLQLLEVD